MVDHDPARTVRRRGMRIVGGIREGNSAREADVMRRPARKLPAHPLERVHLPRHLRERVLDVVSVAVAVDRLRSAWTDASDGPALDLDQHDAEVGRGADDVGLAISRLFARSLLEPGHVAVGGPWLFDGCPNRVPQPILPGRGHC
jgi:hypothetical protein